MERMHRRQKDSYYQPDECPRCHACFMQPHIHTSAQTRNSKVHLGKPKQKLMRKYVGVNISRNCDDK